MTQEQLGRLGAVAFIGLVVGILITGPLADRFGAKAFALLGNALLAIGLGVTGWSPTYGVLLAATFGLGLGAGILDMVLSPVVAAINPERRAAAMNWLHSFYCVGAVVTVVVGTLALQAGLHHSRPLSRRVLHQQDQGKIRGQSTLEQRRLEPLLFPWLHWLLTYLFFYKLRTFAAIIARCHSVMCPPLSLEDRMKASGSAPLRVSASLTASALLGRFPLASRPYILHLDTKYFRQILISFPE